MASRTKYSVEMSETSYWTRKDALKEAILVWKLYVREYGYTNPLIGIYADRKKVGFLSRGVVDGKFYFFDHEKGTFPVKSDGTLGPKIGRVKYI